MGKRLISCIYEPIKAHGGKTRYGFQADCNGQKYPYTLGEVGKIFNVTGERIRQLENNAMKKLNFYNSKKL